MALIQIIPDFLKPKVPKLKKDLTKLCIKYEIDLSMLTTYIDNDFVFDEKLRFKIDKKLGRHQVLAKNFEKSSSKSS